MRLVHFGTVDVHFVAGAAPAAAVPVAKVDVAIEYVGSDTDGRLTLRVPAYDTTVYTFLQAIHVVLLEKTAATPSPVFPVDPAAIVALPLHFVRTTDPVPIVAPIAGGSNVGPSRSVLAQTIVVDATEAPEGSFSAALVAEFDE